MQRADDASARGSVPGEFNEPKDPGGASRSKGKGKVDPVDKKAEKNRIAAKVKAILEARRIPAFRIGGTCEVPSPDAPVAQSLGVTPPASAPFSLDISAIPPCPAVETAVNVSYVVPQHKATLISVIGGVRINLRNPDRLAISEHLFFDWSSDIIGVINTGNHIISAYEAKVQRREDRIKTLAPRSDVDAAWQEEEKHKLEEEAKKRDAHLEVASAEIAELRARMEKFFLTEDHLRKERDRACRRADEIASGSSACSADTLHAQEEVKAQLCYKRGARIILEKMVEAEYELPPGLLENYAKEEEKYFAKVESFDVDSLGDDILFSTLPPPPVGSPQDIAS
ncbi:hypothetical protein AALP_AA6G202900 [Arabis alpina]|uniref:Uncharacterized protein n=1 Tax=Arabis alpina TaxID=50452 RepID=A0A087GQI4_ARAAL|nr:hypothetical protein AALP_AA6G202900 [Arabis alpina]